MFENNLIWDKNKYNEYINTLNSKKENKKFVDFSKKLIFTKYEILGINVPNMRKIAKEISKTNIISFLDHVENNTYEEIMIEGLVISYLKDVDLSLKYFNKFIKKIDNWAICDTCVSSMKIVNKNKKIFLNQIKKYIKSKNQYIVRVGIVLLLDYYIEDNYIDQIYILIDSIKKEDYYINMAIAWLLSFAFMKFKEKTYKLFENKTLSKFVQNKAICKCRDSFQVKKEDKENLINFRIK